MPCTLTGYAQPTAKIDQRLELSGIVFRLAGAEEYVNNEAPQSYVDAINDYFAPYTDHPLIAYIKELRKEPYEIAYNAVPVTADCTVIEHGELRARPEIISIIASKESRWTEPALTRYVNLLTDFYRTSKFPEFFASQHELYKCATERMDDLLTEISTGWFQSFFGKPLGCPAVYVCLSYGMNNYSTPGAYNFLDDFSVNGIIMGCNRSDEYGMPCFEPVLVKPVIIHELCHNFSNPVFIGYYDIMQEAGEKIFPYVKDRLARVAYGDARTMIGEGLNELCALLYYKECDPDWLKYRIEYNENAGFVWIGRALSFMDNFYADRQTYPTIEEFVPQIVGFINYTADNIETVLDEFDRRHPYVTGVYPAPGTTVTPEIKEVRIRFSRPMYTSAYGVIKSRRKDVSPIPDNDCRWESPCKFVISFHEKLKSETTYGFALPYSFFIDNETGHRLQEDYEIIFKTSKR